MNDANWNKRHVAGKMHDTRKAWVNLPKCDIIMFVGDNKEDPTYVYEEETPPVRIEFRVPGRRSSMLISLTHMTVAELDAFEEFMTHAIKRARPIVETLDRTAQEAYENGDDGFERLYRPLPLFIDRERSESEHSEGIQSGPEGSDVEHNSSIGGDRQDDDRDSGSTTFDGTSQDL